MDVHTRWQAEDSIMCHIANCADVRWRHAKKIFPDGFITCKNRSKAAHNMFIKCLPQVRSGMV